MLPGDAPRPRWADVLDSSQEGSREDSRATARSLVEEASYRGEDSAPGLELLREEFSKCARAVGAASQSGPSDFSFLLDGAVAPLPRLQEESAAQEQHVRAEMHRGDYAKGLTSAVRLFLAGRDEDDEEDEESHAAAPASPAGEAGRAGRSGTTGGGLGSGRGSRRSGKRRRGGPGERRGSPEKRARPLRPLAEGTDETTTPEKPQEEAHYRAEKRGRAVEMIKATPDYLAYSRARPADERLDDEPRTPEALAPSVSKRRWEQEVQQWRAGLRQWYQRHGPAAEGAPPAPEPALGDGAGARGAPRGRQPSVLELLQRQAAGAP